MTTDGFIQKSENKTENSTINIIIGLFLLFFAFIVVLYSIFGSDLKLEISSDYILLYLLIVINLLGYALVLLPILAEKLHTYFNNQLDVYAWLIVPIIFVFSILLLSAMNGLQNTKNITDPLII